MTKAITIDPTEVRQSATLKSPDLPLNQYISDPAKEQACYGTETLVRVYRDMALIREFETMLLAFKRESRYRDVEYTYPGPAHLSIGQEAAVVGQALGLTVEDQIFGSHRSHGEILAKSFSAIATLGSSDLEEILEDYFDGAIMRVVEKFSTHTDSLTELAVDYTLYGALAEIFGRSTGFNRGMGGSMHAFFPPFGIMPNNAIVGGSASIATGSALFKRVNRRPGIVIANIGDASLGCGPVWESMVFAAMDQYKTLWPKEIVEPRLLLPQVLS